MFTQFIETINQGFGPTELTLTAMPSGGTNLADGTYDYVWSNTVTSKSISISAAAAGSYNYSVTITDSLGCQSGVTKTINVVDVRCGNNMDKVLVCGPYRFRNIKSCVNENQALLALLFGAKLGTCDNNPQRSIEPGVTDAAAGFSIFPNPNNGSFVIQLNKLNNVEVRVRDQSGRIILRQRVNSSSKVQRVAMNLGRVTNGLYMVEVISKEGVYIAKMLVQK